MRQFGAARKAYGIPCGPVVFSVCPAAALEHELHGCAAAMVAASISIIRFAAKMLRHDQAKTLAGIAGVAFAATLALVQIGLYSGAMQSCSAVIDQSTADLWVVPRGSQNFDFTQPLDEHLLYVVRSV